VTREPRVRLLTPDAALAEADCYQTYCDIEVAAAPPQRPSGVLLWLDADGLQLINPALRQSLHLHEQLLARRLRGGSLLLKACGARPAYGPGEDSLAVLDAFAGFGLDALTMAQRGCVVTALEVQPLVWLMQLDFAIRLGVSLDSQCVNSLEVMGESARQWDVVYLDPMFPARRKRALPNLALQHLQQLAQTAAPEASADGFVPSVLHAARQCARRRVVLKRRAKDPVLGHPSHQLHGQAVRFDVYLS